MPKPFAAASLSPGCGHEPQEHQVHEAQTSWQRAWADRSQASTQSGARLKDSRGPEDAAAPQQNTESCRALGSALVAGRPKNNHGAAKRNPAGASKGWEVDLPYEEGSSPPSLLPSSPKF